MSKEEKTTVFSPLVRMSFPNVFKARAAQPGQAEFFSVAMLFPKDIEASAAKLAPAMGLDKKAFVEFQKKQFNEMRNAALKCAVAKFGDAAKEWINPKSPKFNPAFKWPFANGDLKEQWQGYPGHLYMRAKTKFAPAVLDRDRTPIVGPTAEDKFYAGCWGFVTYTCYAYETQGNKGVSFGLQNVMKVADDEKFTGRNAVEDFADLPEFSSGTGSASGDDFGDFAGATGEADFAANDDF